MSENAFPSSLIIIGAGVFGLSTGLAVARRHPSTKITIIDRLTPPVPDSSSVDTTRCIRADYADPIYARLALEAQRKIDNDSDLSRYLYKKGLSFVCDGDSSSRFTATWKAQAALARHRHNDGTIVDMTTPTEVFQRIHGSNALQPNEQELGHKSNWNIGYCNLNDSYIDAEECIRIYYNRCRAQPSITFQCGTPVDHIEIKSGIATGVVLEDGQTLHAERILVAAGAWSPKLVNLEGRVYSSAHEVVWIKVTDEEAVKWKDMSITTNLSTGLNCFPPYKGEIKILRRSQGYCNTVSVPHPENRSKTVKISLPRTIVTNPSDVIPAEAEAAIRKDLREIMPTLADRPFARTKLCWLSQAPTADFLIAPHPEIVGIHAATAGSAHAWKFLPTIGDLVLDSMEGRLAPELVEKWAWERRGADGGNAMRMDGKPVELSGVIRTNL